MRNIANRFDTSLLRDCIHHAFQDHSLFRLNKYKIDTIMDMDLEALVITIPDLLNYTHDAELIITQLIAHAIVTDIMYDHKINELYKNNNFNSIFNLIENPQPYSMIIRSDDLKFRSKFNCMLHHSANDVVNIHDISYNRFYSVNVCTENNLSLFSIDYSLEIGMYDPALWYYYNLNRLFAYFNNNIINIIEKY